MVRLVGVLVGLIGLGACIDARTYRDDESDDDGGGGDQIGAVHDEDLDGIPDDLDNCPDRANPYQADTDELGNGGEPDGVGDACDPEKSANRILLFEPFTADLGTAWSVDGTSVWRSSDDALTNDQVPAGESALRFDRRLNGRLRIELVLEIVQADPGLTVTIAEPWDPSMRRGPGCIVVAAMVGEPSQLEARVIREGEPLPTGSETSVVAPVLDAGAIRRLAVTATSRTSKQCQLDAAITAGAWLGGGPQQLRIAMSAGIVSLRSLIVYELG